MKNVAANDERMFLKRRFPVLSTVEFSVWKCNRNKLQIRQPVKQTTFHDDTTGFPTNWVWVRLQKFHTDGIHYPYLGSERHQFVISALVAQTSFCGKTNGGVSKCRLFSPATLRERKVFFFQGEVSQKVRHFFFYSLLKVFLFPSVFMYKNLRLKGRSK